MFELESAFDEVVIYQPDAYTDYRGSIWTTWKEGSGDYPQDLNFSHDKLSSSRRGVLRGIHGDFKTWKYVSCIHGEMYFVVVDNRVESGTYLKWGWTMLSGENRKHVLLPPGFGNGFYVLSPKCVFSYKLCYPGEYSDVADQFTLKWNDTRVGIDWPTKNPILQKRDK